MLKIGDLVPRSGIYTNPGVVTEKLKDGRVKVDTDPLKVNEFHRHTNTTGLSETEKNKFNEILDEIYSKTDPVKHIDEINDEIYELSKDPKNRNIIRYLKNQQMSIIREVEILPQSYKTLETDVKT